MKIYVNEEPKEVAENSTLSDLIQQLELQPRYVAVEVNLELVPRDQHGETTLSDGDRLEIVTLAGGG